MVKIADDDDDSITVTYTLKLTKKDLVEDGTNPLWKEACWAALLTMRNLDDEIVIRPGGHLEDSLKSFGKTDTKTINLCFMAEALTQAMLSRGYKEFMASTSQT
jgi:hypothetical protein